MLSALPTSRWKVVKYVCICPKQNENSRSTLPQICGLVAAWAVAHAVYEVTVLLLRNLELERRALVETHREVLRPFMHNESQLNVDGSVIASILSTNIQ